MCPVRMYKPFKTTSVEYGATSWTVEPLRLDSRVAKIRHLKNEIETVVKLDLCVAFAA